MKGSSIPVIDLQLFTSGSDDNSAIWNATCCDGAMVEMSTPYASAPTRKIDTHPRSASHDPRTGRSKSSIDTPTIPIAASAVRSNYGAE